MDRPTDDKNLNLSKLHLDVLQGKSDGKIIWQPRIHCWYDDRVFAGVKLPEPLDGMSVPQIYRELGCSARIYDYNSCFKYVDDHRVRRYSRRISDYETEYIVETPAGKVSCIKASTPSSWATYLKKWWITCEEDMKVHIWLAENGTWKWDQAAYDEILAKWGDIGAPTMYMPRVNIQHLFIDVMGVDETVYALYDYPDTVEAYFRALDDNHERMIEVINKSAIMPVNFGDNLHGGMLSPKLFERYVLPAYQRRNELLHKAGKFTYSHWDGDVKPLLPFARECGLDGIEAITPKPQGDVTLQEVKDALGDEVFLVDGIAAVLFDETFPVEELEKQTQEVIELFAPKLVLGISDEMPSTGNIDRIRLVGRIVDEYNRSRG